MSAANVQFLDIDGNPVKEGEKPARFTFRCVRWNTKTTKDDEIHCGMLLLHEGPHTARHGIKHDGQNQNGGQAQWGWDGNRENPTFTPSVNCEKACGWHGYVRNGRCVETNGQDSP